MLTLYCFRPTAPEPQSTSDNEELTRKLEDPVTSSDSQAEAVDTILTSASTLSTNKSNTVDNDLLEAMDVDDPQKLSPEGRSGKTFSTPDTNTKGEAKTTEPQHLNAAHDAEKGLNPAEMQDVHAKAPQTRDDLLEQGKAMDGTGITPGTKHSWCNVCTC